MKTRVACKSCGAGIFSLMAKLTGGQCLRCKRGKRQPVENLRPHDFRALSVEAYLALVQDLPLPSAEQRRAFIDYVATAHSWYKHLPGFLPGKPFYFFIDRSAGCDWLCRQDGSRAISEREKQGFHYSAIPTAEYRTRFGFLNYSCTQGTAVFLSGDPLTLPRDKIVAIPGEDAQACYLPQPVMEAGRVELTAVIHPHFAEDPWWARAHCEAQPKTDWPRSETQPRLYWPVESGGQTTLKKIFERCDEMRTPRGIKEREERAANYIKRLENRVMNENRLDMAALEFGNPDPVLHELLEPERLRQTREMLKSIDRVCMIVREARRAAPERS